MIKGTLSELLNLLHNAKVYVEMPDDDILVPVDTSYAEVDEEGDIIVRELGK